MTDVYNITRYYPYILGIYKTHVVVEWRESKTGIHP